MQDLVATIPDALKQTDESRAPSTALTDFIDMGVFALLQMLSHGTGTALSGMRSVLAASRHPVKGFPLAVCINLRFGARLVIFSRQLRCDVRPLTPPSLCSKLCLRALRTGSAFRAIDTIAGGVLWHARANKQSINVLHMLGVGRDCIGVDVAHSCARCQESSVDFLQDVAGQRLLSQGKQFPAHRAAAAGFDDGRRHRLADDRGAARGTRIALSCSCIYPATDQTVPSLRWRRQRCSLRCRSPSLERVRKNMFYERANLRCAYCEKRVAAAMRGEGVCYCCSTDWLMFMPELGTTGTAPAVAETI
jgi:hypothetical protein